MCSPCVLRACLASTRPVLTVRGFSPLQFDSESGKGAADSVVPPGSRDKERPCRVVLVALHGAAHSVRHHRAAPSHAALTKPPPPPGAAAAAARQRRCSHEKRTAGRDGECTLARAASPFVSRARWRTACPFLNLCHDTSAQTHAALPHRCGKTNAPRPQMHLDRRGATALGSQCGGLAARRWLAPPRCIALQKRKTHRHYTHSDVIAFGVQKTASARRK